MVKPISLILQIIISWIFRKITCVALVIYFCASSNFLFAFDDLKTYMYKGVYEEIGEYYQHIDDCEGLQPDAVLAKFYNGAFETYSGSSRAFNKGMTACNYWLVISVENAWKRERRLLWSFFNNGIEVTYYELDKGQLNELATASLHQPLLDRPFPSRGVSYPFYLDKGERKVFFAKVRPTINGHVYFPTEMNDVEDYFIWEIDFTYLFGKFAGIFLFAMFINLFFFILLRDSVYINHFAYILFVLLFQLSDFHIDAFQFAGGFFEIFSYINKGAFISMTIFFYSRVFRQFTELDTSSPILGRVLSYLNIVLLLLALSSLVVSFGFPDNAVLAYQFSWLLNWVNNIGFGLLFSAVLVGFIRGNKYFILYGIASSLLLYGFLAYLLNTFDIYFLPIINPGNIINGLVFEVALLTIFLIYKYKIEREEDNEKILAAVQRNELLSQRMVDLQEEERQSIAKDVHDEVANDIAALQLYIQNSISQPGSDQESPAYLLDKVSTLHQKVRNVSHELMSLPTDDYWIDSVKEVVSFYQEHTANIEFNFYTDVDKDGDYSVKVKAHLLRIIKEIVSNIVKHAQATKAYIQLLQNDNGLTLTIEDNGCGFDTTKEHAGIGLNNIAFRTEYLNGTLALDSNNDGTNYMITIPNA